MSARKPWMAMLETAPVGKEIDMPQKVWTAKRERQYEHIKDAYEDRGVSTDEAEERAARTVNKERRAAGETRAQRAKRS